MKLCTKFVKKIKRLTMVLKLFLWKCIYTAIAFFFATSFLICWWWLFLLYRRQFCWYGCYRMYRIHKTIHLEVVEKFYYCISTCRLSPSIYFIENIRITPLFEILITNIQKTLSMLTTSVIGWRNDSMMK